MVRHRSARVIDQLMYDATKGMEDLGFQNINNAYALGYFQVTPFIPGQGRHLMRGAGLDRHDLNRGLAVSRRACCTHPIRRRRAAGAWAGRCSSSRTAQTADPAGRLPRQRGRLALPRLTSASGTTSRLCRRTCHRRSACAVPATPSGSPKAGWLLHLWNFVPNPAGRLVEVNNRLHGEQLVAASALMQIDEGPVTVRPALLVALT